MYSVVKATKIINSPILPGWLNKARRFKDQEVITYQTTFRELKRLGAGICKKISTPSLFIVGQERYFWVKTFDTIPPTETTILIKESEVRIWAIT